jgi:hypothetical protein
MDIYILYMPFKAYDKVSKEQKEEVDSKNKQDVKDPNKIVMDWLNS